MTRPATRIFFGLKRQIPKELFQRIKAHLDRESKRRGTRLTQRDFVVGLIEQALNEAEREAARTEEATAEQSDEPDAQPETDAESPNEEPEADADGEEDTEEDDGAESAETAPVDAVEDANGVEASPASGGELNAP